jgi:hypothetical protein
MPSVTLHLVLADRVLDRWLDAPYDAPFDPHNPSFSNAFFQGAFGPDLGYFPGGHKLLSELSHLVRSGDLTRSLAFSARTPLERAFAWGWATHVLADCRIHPLVGRAVGEFIYGDRTMLADGARHQVPHVQVETGLDAFYSRLFPEIRRRRMAPVFDRDSIGFLARAYRETYSLDIDPSVFLTSHRATARKSVQGLVTVGLLSTALLAKPISATFSGSRWVCQRALAVVKLGLGKHPLAKAFLSPIPPAEWLIREVGEEVEGFANRFFHHFRTGLAELENSNLDTGEAQSPFTTHVGTLQALEALERAGGRLAPLSTRTSSRHVPEGMHDRLAGTGF